MGREDAAVHCLEQNPKCHFPFPLTAALFSPPTPNLPFCTGYTLHPPAPPTSSPRCPRGFSLGGRGARAGRLPLLTLSGWGEEVGGAASGGAGAPGWTGTAGRRATTLCSRRDGNDCRASCDSGSGPVPNQLSHRPKEHIPFPLTPLLLPPVLSCLGQKLDSSRIERWEMINRPDS